MMLAGCSREATTQPATAPAAASTEPAITASSTTPRLVSTVPAATLQLVQLGAVDTLVGVSSYDKLYLPENKQDLPVVGDYLNFNYETLLTLKPTHIIVQIADERLAPRLKEIAAQNHIQIVNIKLDNLANLFATARTLGTISGTSTIAEQKVKAAEDKLENIRKKTADLRKLSTLYIVGKSPIFVVGKDGFMHEMLTIAGADNVGARIPGDYFPQISRETLTALAPEVLLISAPDQPASQGPGDPRIAEWLTLKIPAAENQRVYLMTDGNFILASLSVGENTAALAKLLHPELQLDEENK